MFKPLVFVSSLLAVFGQSANAYSLPGACTGACWAHDPSIVQRDTDGLYFKFNTGSSMEIVTATSLAGPWTIQGDVLPGGTSITHAGQTTDLWAPDVFKVGDLYHLYYTVSTFGSRQSAIGLATSSTMEPGSWTDKGAIGVTSTEAKPYNAIDANLLQVGTSYVLTFGSFWGCIYQVEMNSAATKTVGTPAYQVEYYPVDDHPAEGAFIFENEGFYYLTWSQGICCGYDETLPAAGKEYKIMMCRSESATGGFVDQAGVPCTDGGGSVLLESHGNVYGPGGQ